MPDADSLHTPLTPWHRAQGARLVPFGGWLMPLQYSTITDEHHAVRSRCGLFDISHMGRLAFQGPHALPWLEKLTTNAVARLTDGQIQYSLMLEEHGGIIDDILVYRIAPETYTVVCNASNRPAVLAQLLAHRPDGAGAETLADRTPDTAMIALQGPRALEVLSPLATTPLAGLRYYHATLGTVAGTEALISRTGYTGEDGFELIVPAPLATPLWDRLLAQGQAAGLVPCGLGARDTLRFEAAMPLYGHELDLSTNPYEAGLGWAVKPAKGDFIGRDAIQPAKANPARTRIGLALPEKRIARQGYPVLAAGQPVGVVTSGTFSPTLGKSLAMALIDSAALQSGTPLAVDIRGQAVPAEVVPLPFYRRDQFLNAGIQKPPA